MTGGKRGQYLIVTDSQGGTVECPHLTAGGGSARDCPLCTLAGMHVGETRTAVYDPRTGRLVASCAER